MRCLRQGSFVKGYVEAMHLSFVTSAIYVILAGLKIVFSIFMSATRSFESDSMKNRIIR